MITTGKMLVSDIPPMRVIARSDGLHTTHDNRRLYVFKFLAEQNFLTTVPCELVKTPIPAWQLTTTDDGKSIALRQRGERAPPEVLEAFYEQKRSAPVNPGGAASSSTAGATVDTLRRWSCKVTLTQLVEVKREEQLSASACQPEGALSHPTSPEVRIQPVKRRPQ